ncbi:hypothetical protein J3459_006803 [Metarhizium acridum]|nr:hypothetical protein J3459_006803 [Metarhizium acridum]
MELQDAVGQRLTCHFRESPNFSETSIRTIVAAGPPSINLRLTVSPVTCSAFTLPAINFNLQPCLFRQNIIHLTQDTAPTPLGPVPTFVYFSRSFSPLFF